MNKDMTLSVILMLAPHLESPRRRVSAEKCSFYIAGAGVRREPMQKYWDRLPDIHKRICRGVNSARSNRRRKTYITPEAMALWQRWNGEP